MEKVTINIVTYRPDDDKYVMRLVEQGPWPEEEIKQRLHQLQERLYNCVDVAVDGHLAKEYPDTRGKTVVIRLNCYDIPNPEVARFFDRFSQSILKSNEVQRDIDSDRFIRSLEFEFQSQQIGSANQAL